MDGEIIPIKKSEFKNSIRSQFVSALEGTKGEVGEGRESRVEDPSWSSTRATKPARINFLPRGAVADYADY